MTTTYKCSRCKRTIAKGERSTKVGKIRYQCKYCRQISYFDKCEPVKTHLAMEWEVEFYPYRCGETSSDDGCNRIITETDGNVELLIQCRYCGTLNETVKQKNRNKNKNFSTKGTFYGKKKINTLGI